MSLLSIEECAGLLGPQVSFKPEFHGDETITAMDLSISNVKLTDEQVNIIMGEARASNLLFNDVGHGKVPEPTLANVDYFSIKGRTKGVEVTFLIGTTSLKYAGCIMKRVRVETEHGGDSSLSCSLRIIPHMKQELQLAARGGQEVRISIHAPAFGEDGEEDEEASEAADDQPGLPLDDKPAAVTPASRKRDRKTRRHNGTNGHRASKSRATARA